jgi:hypothetical protein
MPPLTFCVRIAKEEDGQYMNVFVICEGNDDVYLYYISLLLSFISEKKILSSGKQYVFDMECISW